MKVTWEPNQNKQMITQYYELNDKEMEILHFIQKHGWIGFCHIKYGEYQSEYHLGDETYFHYNDFTDLLLHRFIYEDKDKWCAYVLSPLGEMFTSKSLT